MAVVWVLARAGFRRRRGLVGLGVVVALGIGVALASFEAARRTDRAYPSYLDRSEVGELVVNPSLMTDQVEDLIASTPGVRSYASHSFLLATFDGGEPRLRTDVESDPNQLIVSADGRYVEQDRPVVHEGRMIRSGAEAFVSVESARALSLEVGDTLPLAFWYPSYIIPGAGDPSSFIEPIGRAEATVVGIGVFSDEVLVDELYPRRRILVTPEVGSEFDCTPDAPAADDPRTIEELVGTFAPPDCSLTYRYFSLRVEGGGDGARAVADTLATRFAHATETLPAAMQAADNGFFVIPSLTSEDEAGVERSLEPAVTALNLFGVAAGATTLVVVLLVALRIARRDEDDARVWLHLGATRAQRTAGIALPMAVAGGAGLAGSLVVGWVGSGIGPVGSARAVEPAGRMGLSGAVVVLVLAAAAAILAVAFPLAASGATRSRTRSAARGPSWLSRSLPRVGSPSVAAGVRAALRSSGARALLAASVAAVAAVVATTVFTTSLNRFVSDRGRFGWPYDAAVMVGFGYGGSDEAAIAATLDRPEVEAWGMATLDSGSSIEGEPVPFVADRGGFNSLPLPVIEGALPVADDEIALGALTADRLGLGVGDKARLTTTYGEQEATVSGVVVLPTVGQYEADRTSLGTGALLSEQFTDRILGEAEREFGMETASLTDGSASFVAIDLKEGVDSARFLADISDGLRTWDSNGYYPFLYPDPVRPAPVADVAAMKAVPLALVGVFALTMVAGLGLGIAAATRARRRELAVLRALGCVGGQLRASVRWHAFCVVGVGLVVGVPIGIALGRTSYHAFAEGLGFFPEPEVSVWWTLLIVVGALGIGFLASAGPAHLAARAPAAGVLRNE